MKIAAFIIAAIVLVILFMRIESWRKRKKINLVFSGRPSLTTEQFYDLHRSLDSQKLRFCLPVSLIVRCYCS